MICLYLNSALKNKQDYIEDYIKKHISLIIYLNENDNPTCLDIVFGTELKTSVIALNETNNRL